MNDAIKIRSKWQVTYTNANTSTNTWLVNKLMLFSLNIKFDFFYIKFHSINSIKTNSFLTSNIH